MKYLLLPVALVFGLCTTKTDTEPVGENLISGMTIHDLGAFRWWNEPEEFHLEGDMLLISPGEKTDFFNDPASGSITSTAPFLFQQTAEDFVLTAKVKPNLGEVWNACALMVYKDSLNWGKLCFENSDATGPSVVSVVTKGTSDDCNGPIINDMETLWLRVARRDNLFGFYWSKDGLDFRMTRLFALPADGSIRTGLVAQCPVSKTAMHEFQFLSIENRRVEDMRAGY